MADQGVNYCRIWLDLPPWSIEHERSGRYDPEKAQELDRFLELCRASRHPREDVPRVVPVHRGRAAQVAR